MGLLRDLESERPSDDQRPLKGEEINQDGVLGSDNENDAPQAGGIGSDNSDSDEVGFIGSDDSDSDEVGFGSDDGSYGDEEFDFDEFDDDEEVDLFDEEDESGDEDEDQEGEEEEEKEENQDATPKASDPAEEDTKEEDGAVEMKISGEKIIALSPNEKGKKKLEDADDTGCSPKAKKLKTSE